MTINIIGMGEIGTAIYDAFNCVNMTGLNLVGTDVSKERLKELKSKDYVVSNKINKSADIFIIAVYTSQQVLSVLKELKKQTKKVKKRQLVSIESTVNPNALSELKLYNKMFDVVLFPHRYNPNDKEHHVFNLHRIMGAFTDEALQKALDFFGEFMDRDLISIFPPEIVILAKPMENFYRFAEIVLAQEISCMCEKKEIDFDLLREACNTKWNIDIKEARDGVGGKCLPKDATLMFNYFDYGLIYALLVKNETYIAQKELEKKESES